MALRLAWLTPLLLLTLLPLLVSTEFLQYRLQNGLFSGSASAASGGAASAVVCSARCAARQDFSCGGFTLRRNGTCLLFDVNTVTTGTLTPAQMPQDDGARSYVWAAPPPETTTAATTTTTAVVETTPASTCPGDPTDPCLCPTSWLQCGGRCIVWRTTGATYAEARDGCRLLGAHLAVARSESEYQCTLGSKYGWVGVSDEAAEGVYVGEDGLGPVTIPAAWWDPSTGEPTDTGSIENCVMTGGSKPWADKSCAAKYYYLCQLSGCYKPAECV